MCSGDGGPSIAGWRETVDERVSCGGGVRGGKVSNEGLLRCEEGEELARLSKPNIFDKTRIS
jgi:hypothetical protein